jgi:hypothetical protein
MPKTIMYVSPELLRDALNLPIDTAILGARYDAIAYGGSIILDVDHPDIPKKTKYVIPTFRRQDPVIFLGWDLKLELEERDDGQKEHDL